MQPLCTTCSISCVISTCCLPVLLVPFLVLFLHAASLYYLFHFLCYFYMLPPCTTCSISCVISTYVSFHFVPLRLNTLLPLLHQLDLQQSILNLSLVTSLSVAVCKPTPVAITTVAITTWFLPPGLGKSSLFVIYFVRELRETAMFDSHLETGVWCHRVGIPGGFSSSLGMNTKMRSRSWKANVSGARYDLLLIKCFFSKAQLVF